MDYDDDYENEDEDTLAEDSENDEKKHPLYDDLNSETFEPIVVSPEEQTAYWRVRYALLQQSFEQVQHDLAFEQELRAVQEGHYTRTQQRALVLEHTLHESRRKRREQHEKRRYGHYLLCVSGVTPAIEKWLEPTIGHGSSYPSSYFEEEDSPSLLHWHTQHLWQERQVTAWDTWEEEGLGVHHFYLLNSPLNALQESLLSEVLEKRELGYYTIHHISSEKRSYTFPGVTVSVAPSGLGLLLASIEMKKRKNKEK